MIYYVEFQGKESAETNLKKVQCIANICKDNNIKFFEVIDRLKRAQEYVKQENYKMQVSFEINRNGKCNVYWWQDFYNGRNGDKKVSYKEFIQLLLNYGKE